MTTPTTNRKTIDAKGAVGGVLRPNASIAIDFWRPIRIMIERMAKETKREMIAALEVTGQDWALDAADGGVQARIRLNKLQAKWASRFNKMAKETVARMMKQTLKNSAVTLAMSLKEISEDFKVDTSFIDERLEQVISASTQEAANLIKLIPQQYLGEVQGDVMRSITSGNGLKDLIPQLNARYDGNIKRARNTAMDQTRKSYQTVTATRVQAIGATSFVWIHTSGSAHPRKDHIALSGKEFRYDDPPVIAVMAGVEVKGIPGQAINCRCVQKPVLNW